MAMEPVTTSNLTENPQLTMRVGPYTYEVKRNGKEEHLLGDRWKRDSVVPNCLCLRRRQDGPNVRAQGRQVLRKFGKVFTRSRKDWTLLSGRLAQCRNHS